MGNVCNKVNNHLTRATLLRGSAGITNLVSRKTEFYILNAKEKNKNSAGDGYRNEKYTRYIDAIFRPLPKQGKIELAFCLQYISGKLRKNSEGKLISI